MKLFYVSIEGYNYLNAALIKDHSELITKLKTLCSQGFEINSVSEQDLPNIEVITENRNKVNLYRVLYEAGYPDDDQFFIAENVEQVLDKITKPFSELNLVTEDLILI